jgi:KUP system potassium uptake protein
LTEPYKTEYKVTEIIKDDLYRIDFNLGFRTHQKNKPDVPEVHGMVKKEKWISPAAMNP